MRLKRLEMVGFKSFAQKTVIEITPGVTAVVGPNGCGKSNIVDALRWAMGEQSARHLRGHHMEDVVFNGSDSLPATGMAEVSIIFDNEDGRAPAEYSNFSEIMVTRRLFRSGESEYAINKISCRLKDIVDLFLGTGVGSKAYSIVEQGKVDELVNSKPEERRGLIEEAAGTSKYKSRRIVAENKLDRTQQNLLRVSDIVREIERQIRAMELQAKKAERYRALKSELKQKELAFTVLQRDTFTQEIAEQEAALASVENRLAGHLASLHRKEAENEAVRLSLLEADREIGLQQENVYQRRMQIQSDEQKCEFFKKDLSQLEQSEAEARAALSQFEERTQTLAQEIDELNKAKESFVQLSLFEETFLLDKESELEKLQAQIRMLQDGVEREKEALIDAANQIAYLKNDFLAKDKRRGEISKELARSEAELSETTESLGACDEKRNESSQALGSCAEEMRQRALEAAHVAASIQALSRARQAQEKKIAALKAQIQENRSRLESLADLQKNYEGYQEGVRAIMLKKQQEVTPNGIYGLVADVIDAPEAYEKALTAVLGDRLQYIIVKGHQEGLEAIEYLKNQASGRGSFIPRELSRKLHKELPLGESEVIAPLINVISVKEGYHDVAEYLLSDVVVVRDLQAGLALWNRNGYYSTLVTPDGEVIDPMGIVTGGSGAPLERSVLTQRRRIRELASVLAQLESQLPREERESETLKQELDQAETKKNLLSAEIHRLELERVRLEHEQRAANQELERLTQSVRALTEEQSDLTATLHLVNEEIQRCLSTTQARSEEKLERERVLAQKQTACAELRQAVGAAESAVTQSRVRNAALGEKRENTHTNLANRLKLQEATAQEIATCQTRRADFQRRRQEIEQALAHTEEALLSSRSELQKLEQQLQTERQKYRGISMQLAEIGEAIKELRPLGESCQEEKSGVQLSLAEKRLGLQHLAANLREKYDADLDTLSVDLSENGPSKVDLVSEIDELRGRLERMGEVNLAAIGEYEELTTRFKFMNQQKEDLEKSIADLQQTIVKLNRVCRLRFKESFEAINEKFEVIFPRLFRGGKAKLVLTDENDYLETGVDIVVQPPGKKLQSITLLSGGEKALTAVSLLFAIFLTKPSPFCFLDEVDAPLDDANIDRFTELITEMSEHSQFVLVTHNKKSMQAAEVLYGITMAEPGVSKVVSVRMT
ncbi:MAG: chromosome segregation protein SMC [Deltaproteobacteria bacterium]|nr:MAG: chromosome segregation protein SMC [Deltaproteobacteria bacterium]